MVATADGFVVYNGGGKRGADFTPIDAATSSRVAAAVRRQLAQTRIAPSSTPPAADATISTSSRDGGDRPAQLAR